ncbi:hypothetical protein ABIC02_007667 [Bradyrhizobium sp. RT5a]
MRCSEVSRSGEVSVQQLACSFQFLLQAKPLPDKPYDGHTLCHAVDDAEALTGSEIERTYVNKGYRDHDAQNSRSAFIFGHERRVIEVFARELRHRHAIEFSITQIRKPCRPLLSQGSAGDAANLILTAILHDFRFGAAINVRDALIRMRTSLGGDAGRA